MDVATLSRSKLVATGERLRPLEAAVVAYGEAKGTLGLLAPLPPLSAEKECDTVTIEESKLCRCGYCAGARDTEREKNSGAGESGSAQKNTTVKERAKGKEYNGVGECESESDCDITPPEVNALNEEPLNEMDEATEEERGRKEERTKETIDVNVSYCEESIIPPTSGATRVKASTSAMHRLSVAVAEDEGVERQLLARSSFCMRGDEMQSLYDVEERETDERAKTLLKTREVLSVKQLKRKESDASLRRRKTTNLSRSCPSPTSPVRERKRTLTRNSHGEFGHCRDWNGEFQKVRERARTLLKSGDRTEALRALERAHEINEEFCQEVETVASRIIEERALSEDQRSIQVIERVGRGACGERYLHEGIFYKLATRGQVFDSLEISQKASRCEFRALQEVHRLIALPGYAYAEGDKEKERKDASEWLSGSGKVTEKESDEVIHVTYTLTAEVTYRGMRVTATCALPIEGDKRAFDHFYYYGEPLESAPLSRYLRQESTAVKRTVERLCGALHVIRSEESGREDTVISKGSDGRHYVTQAAIFPPTHCLSNTDNNGDREATEAHTHSDSGDEERIRIHSSECDSERERKRERGEERGGLLAYKMRPSFVQQYPKALANSYGFLDEGSSLANGSSCAADVDIVAATAFLEETLVPRLAAQVQERYRNTALDRPDWRTVLHVAGLNVRHLGLLRDSLDLSCQHLRGWLLLEMIARTVKSELRSLFRDAAGKQEAVLRRHTAGYLNMVFGSFPQSKEYRCRELKQRLQEKFRKCALDEDEEAAQVDLLALDQLPSSLLAERLHELGVVCFSREVRQRLAFLPLPFALPSVALLEAGDISCPPVVKDSGLLSLEKTLLHAAWPQPHRAKLQQQAQESGAWEHAVCGLAHLAPLLQQDGSNWHARNAAAAIYLRLARWYGSLGSLYLDERLHCVCLAVEHAGIAAQVAPRSPIALSGHALALHRCADALTALLPHILDRGDLTLVPSWLREVLVLLTAGSLSYARALAAEPAWPAAAHGWAQLVDQQRRICAKETLVDVLELRSSQADVYLSHLSAVATHVHRLAELEAKEREPPSMKFLQTLELLFLAVSGTKNSGRCHAFVSPLLQQRSRYQTSIACETVPASCWLVFCDKAVGRLLEEESTRQVVGRLLVREQAREQSQQGQLLELQRLLEVEQLQRNPVSSLFQWLSSLFKRCEKTTEAPAFRSMYFVTVVTLLKVASLSGEQELRLQEMFESFRRVCKSLGRTTLTFCDCYGISTDEDFIRSILEEEEALCTSQPASQSHSPTLSSLSSSFLMAEKNKATSSQSTGDLHAKTSVGALRGATNLSKTLSAVSLSRVGQRESGSAALTTLKALKGTGDHSRTGSTEMKEEEESDTTENPPSVLVTHSEIPGEEEEQPQNTVGSTRDISEEHADTEVAEVAEVAVECLLTGEQKLCPDTRTEVEPDRETVEMTVEMEEKAVKTKENTVDRTEGPVDETGESEEISVKEPPQKHKSEAQEMPLSPVISKTADERISNAIPAQEQSRESLDRTVGKMATSAETETETLQERDTVDMSEFSSDSDSPSVPSRSEENILEAPGTLTPNTARRERALTAIVCKGTVLKKGSGRGIFGRHNWKQRTLVLSRTSLRYYAAEGLLLGSIDDLSAVCSVESEFSKKGGYAIRLVMADPKRPLFTFVVESVQDRDQWLTALRQAMPAAF